MSRNPWIANQALIRAIPWDTSPKRLYLDTATPTPAEHTMNRTHPEESPMNEPIDYRGGAAELEIRPDAEGRMWITTASVVGLLDGMCSVIEEQAVKRNLEGIAAIFRKMISEDQLLEAAAEQESDESGVLARHCAECGVHVIDAITVFGELVTVNIDPDPAGELVVTQVKVGVATVAPWTAEHGGFHEGPRLTAHAHQLPPASAD